MPAPPKPSLREAGAALRVREFRIFWIGALLSNSGGWMQNIAVPFVLYELTESATWVGLATFAQFLPAVLLGPVGGALADRYRRRDVLLVTQAAMAALAVALWALWTSGAAEPWSITLLVAAVGAVGGLNIGSWQAFVSELVPRHLLLNAVTLNSAQFNGARAFGPALGGAVLALWGPGAAFLLNGVSFVAVLVALVRIGPVGVGGTRSQVSVLRDTLDTVGYVRTQPGIAVCVLAVAALGFFGSPLFPFLAVFAEQEFAVEGLRYGLLGASLGIGAVIGAPFIASTGASLRRSTLITIGLAGHGGMIVAFALSPSYWFGIAALLAGGAAYLALSSTLNTTIQVQVAEHRRGKVLSLYVMGLTGTYPLGALAQGAIADVVGVRPVSAVAGAMLVLVLIVLRTTGRLRATDDDPAEESGVGGAGERSSLHGAPLDESVAGSGPGGSDARSGLDGRVPGGHGSPSRSVDDIGTAPG